MRSEATNPEIYLVQIVIATLGGSVAKLVRNSRRVRGRARFGRCTYFRAAGANAAAGGRRRRGGIGGRRRRGAVAVGIGRALFNRLVRIGIAGIIIRLQRQGRNVRIVGGATPR